MSKENLLAIIDKLDTIRAILLDDDNSTLLMSAQQLNEVVEALNAYFEEMDEDED